MWLTSPALSRAERAELKPGHGPLQVFHFQPEERACPRHAPDRLCRPVPVVRVNGRCFPQEHPTELHQDASVGRLGELACWLNKALNVKLNKWRRYVDGEGILS